MTLVFLVLRGTSVSMTDATWFLEIGELCPDHRLRRLAVVAQAAADAAPACGAGPAHSLSAAHAHAHDHDHDHATVTHQHDHHHDHGHHHHAEGEVCATCGHSHAPDPACSQASISTGSTAWSAVAAVGIRPCSGALIVLSFAFLNGLWAGGILSVLAMALGTAITVSALATLAVTAKNWAVAIAGDGRVGNRVHHAVEIGGAALVMLLGLTLLAASLNA